MSVLNETLMKRVLGEHINENYYCSGWASVPPSRLYPLWAGRRYPSAVEEV